MTGQLISIGAVIVTPLDVTNPYVYVREGGAFASGFWRVQALKEFRNRGEGTLGLKLWHAPGGGGAREITADDVNWDTMGGAA